MDKNKSKLTRKSRRGRPPKHGGYSLLTKGELPDNRQYLRAYLTDVREGLIRDLGPKEENLTTAQLVLIDRVITKLGIIRLIEEHVKEKGIFKDGKLSACLRENYLAFDNGVRLGLQAVGINKTETEKIMSLESYLKQKKREKEQRNGE